MIRTAIISALVLTGCDAGATSGGSAYRPVYGGVDTRLQILHEKSGEALGLSRRDFFKE